MSAILTSWKEIAQYFGKGVRTVQRWERSLGLPVRRPNEHVVGMVIAVTDELDEWVRSQQKSSHSTQDDLQSELARLQAENEQLRLRIELLETRLAVATEAEFPPTNGDDTALDRALRLIQASTLLRQQSADMVELSRRYRKILDHHIGQSKNDHGPSRKN